MADTDVTRGPTPRHGSNRQACTGILLVGGASERFGSPKALASFRGEPLGERAWRVLHEACEEVVAVGKLDEASDLPFSVLDDGSTQRAPVFGVIAGLRAASYETTLALPVDLPLVTAELLRTLLDANAVPQTGPLPGVYAKSVLPELESRVERGELSLRGVNTRVVEVDEASLVNVNTPTDLVVAMAGALDRAGSDARPIGLPDASALRDLSSDFWSTALWETIDLFQGLEEETARRLGLPVEHDHADLRRRVAEVVRDPRHASTL